MDTSVYSHALDLWSKADLTELQKNLDSDVLDIKENESSFLDSRKSLATETKKFKKLDEAEKLASINKLIKQYQQEIDGLTKRSKLSESILFDIYSRISETPDPKPLLQNSIEKFSNVEDAKKLKESNDLLEDKLAKYADYESLKSRLLELEQSSAIVLTKRLAAQENEINSCWKAKQKNWEEKETEFIKQIQNLKENNQALEVKISKQVDFDAEDGKTTDDKDNKFVNITENNFLVQELDSAQSRIFQLEKRNEELTTSLAKVTNESKKDSDLLEKQMKISQLESENALLSASSERERIAQEKSKSTLTDQLKTSKVELESYKTELENVRRKLNNYSDYNKIKEELGALKKIEFGVDGNDEKSEDEDMNNNNNTDNKMENTLLAANKKLQSNLAILRSKDVEQKEEIERLQENLQTLKAQVGELDKANQKLEQDLEVVEKIEENFNDTASMMSGITRQMNNRGGVNGGGRLSPTSSIIGIPEESELSSSMLSNNSTILPIVTKQRDRFRTKNMELEKQIRQVNNEKGKLQSEINKLSADCKKLTEHLRYSSLDTSNKGNFGFDAEAQSSKSLNPLLDHKRKESEYYKTSKLPFTERAFMAFARVVGSTKTSRMIFIIYSLGIHGLLLVLLMSISNMNSYSNVTGGSSSVHNTAAAAAASKLGSAVDKTSGSGSGTNVGGVNVKGK